MLGKDDVRKKVIEVFWELGIIIDESEENFMLHEYIADSLEFIALLTEIECAFSIEIPDEALFFDNENTLLKLINIIEEQLTKK